MNAETEARILQQQRLISELQFHNDQLKMTQQNLDLSMVKKDHFISILIHDLRLPLRFLYKNTAYLFRNWKADSHDEVDYLITEINQSTQQIHFLTEEMMQWIAAQNKSYRIYILEHHLVDLLKELKTLYEETILHQGNTLELDVPPSLTVKTDKILLKAVLRNLLDNANKNTDDGFIRIQARQVGQSVSITVADTGVGLSPEWLRAINHFFRTGESSPSLNTQVGHEIIRDFARLLNATVLYEAPESGGLCVRLTLPC
ncbi:hypothetical protein GCM10027347_11340 [Larkinella harenae]